MKKIKKYKICLLFISCVILLFSFMNSSAQNAMTQQSGFVNTSDNHEHQCITPEQYEIMKQRVKSNIQMLRSQGKILPATDKAAVVTQTFDWPLTYNSNFYENDYYFITNYIDHDPDTNNQMLDYNCGTRSYDVFGYNHQGTDIAIGPYSWSLMDGQVVNVIAGAPGIIADKDDFNFDRNCSFGGGNANFVIILHSDGSTALYWHMKNGSVTTKAIGDNVKTGEYLGNVASSGSSTGPHLHFEVEDQFGIAVDPWVGACNPDIVTSLWNNQLPYFNPGILRLITMSGTATVPACPGAETIPTVNHFAAGSTIRFEAHLRDLINGNDIIRIVYDPSGNVLLNSLSTYNGSFNASGFYFNTLNLSPQAVSGTYKYTVSYGGKTAAHYFTVGCPGAYSLTGSHSGLTGYISGSTINSDATIGNSASNNIWYEAESYVQLEEGFRATSGCAFRARLNNCAQGGTKEYVESAMSKTDFKAKLIPNPAVNESMLHISIEAAAKANIFLVNVLGEEIKEIFNGVISEKVSTIPVSLTDVNAGIYFVRIKLNGITKAERIVKL